MRVGGELQHIGGPLAAIMEDLEDRMVNTRSAVYQEEKRRAEVARHIPSRAKKCNALSPDAALLCDGWPYHHGRHFNRSKDAHWDRNDLDEPGPEGDFVEGM